MERAEWLQSMREKARTLYDHISPEYWVRYGINQEPMHQEYLDKFLELLGKPGTVLSAACGAGRFDGLLAEAGHRVVGVDQAAGMLAAARAHFPPEQYPRITYRQVGLQELDFHEAFDGATCLDALEHICPEDWPGIVRGLHAALKPGGVLYITTDVRDADELERCYQNARAMGLPVVYGEVADEVEDAYQEVLDGGRTRDQSVYHFCPPAEQVQEWLEQAGFTILEEAVEPAEGYHHILARR